MHEGEYNNRGSTPIYNLKCLNATTRRQIHTPRASPPRSHGRTIRSFITPLSAKGGISLKKDRRVLPVQTINLLTLYIIHDVLPFRKSKTGINSNIFAPFEAFLSKSSLRQAKIIRFGAKEAQKLVDGQQKLDALAARADRDLFMVEGGGMNERRELLFHADG